MSAFAAAVAAAEASLTSDHAIATESPVTLKTGKVAARPTTSGTCSVPSSHATITRPLDPRASCTCAGGSRAVWACPTPLVLCSAMSSIPGSGSDPARLQSRLFCLGPTLPEGFCFPRTLPIGLFTHRMYVSKVERATKCGTRHQSAEPPSLPITNTSATGDAFSFQIRQMSENPDSPPARFADVLALALDRAVGSSLDSLHTLRNSVRSYTAHQKARGVPLDGVMRAVSAVLMNVEDERSVEPGTEGRRDPELARQLRAWCSEDYSDDSKNVA